MADNKTIWMEVCFGSCPGCDRGVNEILTAEGKIIVRAAPDEVQIDSAEAWCVACDAANPDTRG